MEATFQLKDADGNEHTYVCVAHNVDEGLVIVDRLLAAGLPALAAAVDGMLRTAGGGAAVAALAQGGSLQAGAVLDGLDVASIGQKLAAALPAFPLAEMAPRLLSRCDRDGKQLGNPANFNAAFRGNYAEMLAACWKVAAVNRFFPRLGT